MTVLLVALGAALGAPLRYAWAHLLDARWPLGTLLANSVGSLLVGVFAALSLADRPWAFLGTGFCGALTSFSSFAVQSVERPGWRGAAYVALTVALSLALCAAGFWIASD